MSPTSEMVLTNLASIRKAAGLPDQPFQLAVHPGGDIAQLSTGDGQAQYVSLRTGTQIVAQFYIQQFHGTCGVFTIDHLYDGGELENVLRALMSACSDRLFLYVGQGRYARDPTWNAENVLSKLGKVILSFHNPYHGRTYTLPLWALTSDTTIIKEGIK